MVKEMKIVLTLEGEQQEILNAYKNIKDFVSDVIAEHVASSRIECDDNFYSDEVKP